MDDIRTQDDPIFRSEVRDGMRIDWDVPIPMDLVIARELEILGSHGMPAHRFPAMLDMIASGRLDPGRLIGKTVSLEEAPAELEAMTRFAQQGVTVIDRF